METRRGQHKKRKVKILGLLIIFVLVASGYTFMIYGQNRTAKEKVDETERGYSEIIKTYKKHLNQKNFSEWVKLLSDDSISRYEISHEEVLARYQTIFSGLGVTNLCIEDEKFVKENNEEDDYEQGVFTYNLLIDTQHGSFKVKKYTAIIKQVEDEYQVEWTPELIFPGMNIHDKVRVEQDFANRGEIYDRNGKKLAENYAYQQLGINPSLLKDESQKSYVLDILSAQFNIPVDYIEDKLNQDWAKGDVFVPIKTLEKAISHLEIADLPAGALINYKEMRHYPYAEATAHLLGYVGKVNEEDLEKNPDYSEDDYIGRSGIEAAYEKELRGKDGVSIQIENETGKVIDRIFVIKKIPAVDLTLTIDGEAQKVAFDALENKPASTVVSEPKTGELLVATSAPSFNPNKMVVGISAEDYSDYSEDKNLPFLNRATNRFAPGSTFKTITAAIGLDAGIINTTEERAINGLKWQKDASWGGFYTTRVKDVPIVNLKKALVYSDNIFFAQKSLEMGEDIFRTGLNKFIFGENLDLPVYIEPASISNEETFKSELLLADTAYGQGELMISPVSQLSMYSVLMNEGNLVYPKLLKDQKVKHKKAVVGAESAKIVLNDLVESVTSPEGYVYSLFNPNYQLAAKTGTAEIKEKQDTLGTENSFLLFLDYSNKNFMGLIMSEDSRENGTAVEKAPKIVEYLQKNY